ncbi:MAG TPA: prephenate dehydrogenase/arogenate dehydrogenase family protein [Terriglobia bacterium]|nr:prephenate dehydrogenase/arogenate dehydrogenase family protein [Terriglobia bacterium]
MTADRGFPRTVTIYGTGLIGCSFALALKQTIPAIRLYGIDNVDILSRARAIGAIEAIAETGTGQAPVSDLVVLAAPVGEILRLTEELQPGISIILDMGSTKVDICRRAESRQLPFVGGHPMTGSERSGPEAASADLFKGARFFLCPISSTPPGAVSKLENVIRAIGGVPHVISPENHDRLAAEISHLPQILSTVLADHTGEHREFAGPGLKSVTRLAASPFHVWRDILLTSGSLPGELKSYIQRLQDMLDALEHKDMKRLESVFERANKSVF